MISWLIFNMVLSWQVLPTPQATWQITFDPSQALVTSMGESVLFEGRNIYRYDANGTLQNKGTLAFEPQSVFLDPENRVMVHDGDEVLGRINSDNGIVWQRRFLPADLPIFHFQGYVAYVVGTKVFLLDTEKGWVRYSLERDYEITALAAYQKDLVIADRLGRLLQWNPLTGRRFWLRNQGRDPIQSVTVAGDQSFALVTPAGQLEILDSKRKTRWSRDFHIEIAEPPLWFANDRGAQWVVTTHGRHLYAFGERGKQLADELLPNRPMLLTDFGDQHCVLLAYLSPIIYWYDIENRRFQTQTLPSYQSLVVDQANCLLMIGADGQIRLYQKPVKIEKPLYR